METSAYSRHKLLGLRPLSLNNNNLKKTSLKAAEECWDMVSLVCWSEMRLARGTKDVGNCLISSTPAKGSLGSGGGSICCNSLDSSVSQDSLGELLLGLGEAGTCPPVLRVDLGEWEKGHGLRKWQFYKSVSINLHIWGTSKVRQAWLNWKLC